MLRAGTSRQKHKPRVDLKCTLLVFPSTLCFSLSLSQSSPCPQFSSRPFCALPKAVSYVQGSLALPPLPPTLAALDTVYTQVLLSSYTTSIYTEFEVSPLLGFARLATVPRTLERLMILNLACLKAVHLRSSRPMLVVAVASVQVKPSSSTTTTTLTFHQQLAALKHYFYHNYLYIDSCFSFPFIRFAVVPCSNVGVLVCFFIRGFHDCFQLIF